jgi:hypothetical protein
MTDSIYKPLKIADTGIYKSLSEYVLMFQNKINIHWKKKKNKCGKFVWKQRWNKFLSWLIKIDWRKRVLWREKNQLSMSQKSKH